MSEPMMNHIAFDGFGGPEVMKMTRSPRPEPGPGEVLIRVAYAGVNRPDIVQRCGAYPPPPGVTGIPGLEVSGEVVGAGQGATAFRTGDQVCALVAGGGYAEYVAVPEVQVLRVPRGLPLPSAAALPETFFTVHTNLYDSAALRAGETVLIHAGSSGIGTTAIQMAAALGSRVFTTVSSDSRIASCEALGAEIAVNYRTTDYVAVLKEATGGRGVDVILDMRAGPFFPRNLDLIATGGRIVQIASLAGREVVLDVGLLMRKRAIVTGTTLRARPIEEKGRIAYALEQTVWPLLDQGRIAPQIDCILPLRDAVEAHRRLEAGDVVGKVVLEVSPPQ